MIIWKQRYTTVLRKGNFFSNGRFLDALMSSDHFIFLLRYVVMF